MEPNPYEAPKVSSCKPPVARGGTAIIDVARRAALADLTHEYLAGLLTNREFEHRLHSPDLPVLGSHRLTDDPLLSPMLQRLWLFSFVHGEFDTYRLTGEQRLSTERRREILRWILFLRSDRPYEWPPFNVVPFNWSSNFIDPLVSILTLGYWGRVRREALRRETEQFMQSGDYAVWPFMRREHFQVTLAASCPLRT
jgi:hypothetical protein